MSKIYRYLVAASVVLIGCVGNVLCGQEFESVLQVDQPILVDQGAIPFQDSVLESVAPGPDLISPIPGTTHLPPVSAAPRAYIELPQSYQKPSVLLSEQPALVTCKSCKCKTCCCKPPKVEATVCLVDLHGCEHEVCIEVPVCCQNEAPQVSWKNRRILGRQVATLCWECCDHEVKVVVTRRGKVRVRD